jgi:hypothetical protein
MLGYSMRRARFRDLGYMADASVARSLALRWSQDRVWRRGRFSLHCPFVLQEAPLINWLGLLCHCFEPATDLLRLGYDEWCGELRLDLRVRGRSPYGTETAHRGSGG